MSKILLSLLPLFFVLSNNAWANAIAVGEIVFPTAVIPSGASTSAAITTSGMELVGCMLPAAFTSTAISFVASGTTVGGAYGELDNSSGKVSYTVAAGKYIAIAPADFAGVQFFKIITNATEGTARSLICSMKGI